MKKIQSLLPSDTALFQYLVTEHISYLFVIARDQIKVYTLPLSEAEIQAKVQKFNEQIQKKGEYQTLAQELYQELIAQAENDIKGKGYRQLGILPSQALHQLPFQALMNQDKHLFETIPVFSLVNMGVLERVVGFQGKYDKVIAFGDPVGAKLKHSAEEAQAIGKLMGSEPLIDKDATETKARDSHDANILHFATHGIVNPTDARQSAIYFTKDAQNDGYLTLEEIMGLPWKDQMVFLSACETAIGELKGQEVDSLGNAFMVGGAKTLISSLWKVDDKATSILGTTFYQQLKNEKKSKVSALQQAQLAVMEAGYKHPYYWAPFVLTGDWK